MSDRTTGSLRSKHQATNGQPAPGDALATLDDAINARSERLVRFRRRLHATPETSSEEVETTALVVKTLREAGLNPRVMRGNVGAIVDIDLGASGPRFVASRAELDCVRINDDKQVAYASTRPDLCHACGHDAHSTMVLAAAMVLAENREMLRDLGLRHNIRMIFQPAEETATGARSMIEQGAIDGVEAIIGLHVEPFLDSGTIGVRNGPLTAACKAFRITIKGKSGHTARPHEAIDPVPAAVNVVSLLYQLAPRSIDTRAPLALTVASINAGTSFNAIPDEATIAGTLRTTRDEDVVAVQARMESVIAGVREATGCDIRIEFLHSCPATDNNPEVVGILASAAGEIVGTERVHWIELPSMGGEDFAFYQELIPGAMARLGVGKGDHKHRKPLHSSVFDIDETVLTTGAKVLTHALLDLATNYQPHSA